MTNIDTLDDLGTTISLPADIEYARRFLARKDATDLAPMLGIA